MPLSLNQLRSWISPVKSTAGDDALPDLFLAPPFTPTYTNAVRRISTRLKLEANERSRATWQAESNAASRMELEAIAPMLQGRQKPRRVLEIGPGLGRSVVYFTKSGLWDENAEIDLYDTDGAETKYKQRFYDRPPAWPDVSSFCGDLQALSDTLRYNGIQTFHLHDAKNVPLRNLPGPYDFIYGMYSIGFHWSLEYYLDDLQSLMNSSTVLACTLNKHFTPFPALENYSYNIIETTSAANLPPVRLLVLTVDKGPSNQGASAPRE